MRCCRTLPVAVLLLVSAAGEASAQAILPPAPGAIGGGNPFQGLGRKDDPSPPRYQDFAPKSLQEAGGGTGGLSGTDSSFGGGSPGGSSLGTDSSLGSSLGTDSSLGSDSAPGTGAAFGTDSAFDTGSPGMPSLDSLGVKLQDVPKLLNNLQQQNAKIAGEAGVEMGNNGGSGLNTGDGGLGNGGLGNDGLGDGGLGSSGLGSNGLGNGGLGNRAQSLGQSISPGSGETGDQSMPEVNASGEFENGSPSGLPPGPSGLNVAPLATPLTGGIGGGAAGGNLGGNLGKAGANLGGQPGGTRGGMNARGTGQHPGHGVSLHSPNSSQMNDQVRAALAAHAANQAKAGQHHNRNQLVPPPPPTSMASHSHNNAATPERLALQMIHKGDYGGAEDQLREVVSSNPHNLHARYLLAVALVYRKNYDEARTQYNQVIEKAQDERLVELATEGLRKITR